MSRALTPATNYLRKQGISYTEHEYTYVDRGGTAASAAALGVDEHSVVKTLVMEDAAKKPLVVLMHGDRSVSQKALARAIGTKSVEPCTPETAQRHSGYQVGGTSPFGLRKPLPIYVEESILALPLVYVNGGGRGYLVGIDPKVFLIPLGARTVTCGQ
ncbi:MAG: aminoacyl-tRNA deacylase [Polyangiaceae bacterium]